MHFLAEINTIFFSYVFFTLLKEIDDFFFSHNVSLCYVWQDGAPYGTVLTCYSLHTSYSSPPLNSNIPAQRQLCRETTSAQMYFLLPNLYEIYDTNLFMIPVTQFLPQLNYQQVKCS